jgi:hypothetical protein
LISVASWFLPHISFFLKLLIFPFLQKTELRIHNPHVLFESQVQTENRNDIGILLGSKTWENACSFCYIRLWPRWKVNKCKQTFLYFNTLIQNAWFSSYGITKSSMYTLAAGYLDNKLIPFYIKLIFLHYFLHEIYSSHVLIVQ